MMKRKQELTKILSIGLFIVVATTAGMVQSEYLFQFTLLDNFFSTPLAAIKADYNRRVAPENSLNIIFDILNNHSITSGIDTDLEEDNIFSLIKHSKSGFNSLVLVLEHIRRTQKFLTLPTIEWEATIPFIKLLHHYQLNSGEHVVISKDILGFALKLNGSDFTTNGYHLGYPNIPIEFLEFLITEFNQGSSIKKDQIEISESTFPVISNCSILIEESWNELVVTINFENVTYLFQNNSIDLYEITPNEFTLSKKFLIIEFENISFTINIRKFSDNGLAGMETVTQISIGDVLNLIINEPLPSEGSWDWSTEHTIQKNFLDLVPINEVLSWYSESDIQKRLSLFSGTQFSFLTSHQIAILNGTWRLEDEILVDNSPKTSLELAQTDVPVKEEIKINYNETSYFSKNYIGYDNVNKGENQIEKLESNLIALSQQSGFSGNELFLKTTSLVRDLISEGLKRFINKPEIIQLTNDQLYQLCGLYLPSSRFIQDSSVKSWDGKKFYFNSIEEGISKIGLQISEKNDQITSFSFSHWVLVLLILVPPFKKK